MRTISSPTTFATAEDCHFATLAALLDPICWHLASTLVGGLDVTVPPGRTWYTSNSFAIYLNEPHVYAQDAHPLSRRSGFLRTLDARRTAMLPGGTRVRSNVGIQTAYIWYCDPEDVWSVDARYTADPRELYYGRLARLETLPLDSVVLEATGGGALTDVVSLALPVTGPIMINAVSVYDAAWCTIGWPDGVLNVLPEINNSHGVRNADAVLQPLPWRGSAPLVVLQKASTSDGAGTYPVINGAVAVPSSTSPATAYPIKGTASIWYWALPADW